MKINTLHSICAKIRTCLKSSYINVAYLIIFLGIIMLISGGVMFASCYPKNCAGTIIMMFGCSGFFGGCLYLCACWNLKGPMKITKATYTNKNNNNNNNTQGPLSYETVCLDMNSLVIMQDNNNINEHISINGDSSNSPKLQLLQHDLCSNELDSKLHQELCCNKNCNILELQV